MDGGQAMASDRPDFLWRAARLGEPRDRSAAQVMEGQTLDTSLVTGHAEACTQRGAILPRTTIAIEKDDGAFARGA